MCIVRTQSGVHAERPPRACTLDLASGSCTAFGLRTKVLPKGGHGFYYHYYYYYYYFYY